MAGPLNKLIPQLRQTLLRGEDAGLTDGQLLERFLSSRDGAVLEVLVRRHAPMVWGVCRRVLGNHHDAEDAFQATFLVFVRKAAAIEPREMVPNYLCGVAHQTALNARAAAARRRARERQVMQMPEAVSERRDPMADLRPLLDQELSRLPDKYRALLVLCELEGRTRKEAAGQLGLPEGTVASRLARARALLAKRLARHGLAVLAGSLGAVVAADAASVPGPVVSSTVKAAALFAAGRGVATTAIPAAATALAEGLLKAMSVKKISAVMAVVVLGLAGTGGGLLHMAAAAHRPNEQPSARAARGEPDRHAAAAPTDRKPGPPSPPKDSITPEMGEALARANKVQAGMDPRKVDEAVEGLYRVIARTNPKVFVPLAAPHLIRLAPRSPKTRAVLRQALAKGWLEPELAHADLIKAGDPPGPHVRALRKALDDDDPKVRKRAIHVFGWVGAAGAPALPRLREIVSRAKADPSDYVRAYPGVAQTPEHVMAYFAIRHIEAGVRKR